MEEENAQLPKNHDNNNLFLDEDFLGDVDQFLDSEILDDNFLDRVLDEIPSFNILHYIESEAQPSPEVCDVENVFNEVIGGIPSSDVNLNEFSRTGHEDDGWYQSQLESGKSDALIISELRDEVRSLKAALEASQAKKPQVSSCSEKI